MQETPAKRVEGGWGWAGGRRCRSNVHYRQRGRGFDVFVYFRIKKRGHCKKDGEFGHLRRNTFQSGKQAELGDGVLLAWRREGGGLDFSFPPFSSGRERTNGARDLPPPLSSSLRCEEYQFRVRFELREGRGPARPEQTLELQ